jgi:ATP-binding cassette, subfamily C (CFTR/MRP), member 1
MDLDLSSELCDAAFGPPVQTSCRSFDFTLYFEDVVLATLPAAVFLLALPLPAFELWKGESVVKFSKSLAFKSVGPRRRWLPT